MQQAAAPAFRGLGRDFGYYIVGRAVSAIGDRIALIALIFLVIHLSRGFPFTLGLFYLARLVPMVLGGLFAGLIADYVNRRLLMIGCDVGRAVLLFVVPSLSTSTLWTLFPMVMVLYALTLLFSTASQAALPDVVPEEGMTRANGILRAVNTSADLAYAVGGSLIYVLGLTIPFYIDAATFGFSALMVARMRIPRQATGELPRLSDAWTRVSEGFAYIASTPFLKWSSVTFGLAPLAGGVMFVLVPLYADRILRGGRLAGPLQNGAFRFSTLEVSLGVGALLGSVVAVRLAERWPRGRIFALGILGMGCVDLMFAPIRTVYAALPVMALHGLFNSLFLVSGYTLVQQLTPSEMRGRVLAGQSSLVYGALALGSAVGGVLLDRVPYSTMWLVLGATIAGSSLFIWLQPEVREQR